MDGALTWGGLEAFFDYLGRSLPYNRLRKKIIRGMQTPHSANDDGSATVWVMAKDILTFGEEFQFDAGTKA